MNDFQIISKLGEGAYSTVYKVKRLVDDKVYALKKVKLLNLSEKEKLNSLNEVRILASVKSNFVISYKEAFFDEKDSTLGIVMEYADKGDLYQEIVKHKKSAAFFEEIEIWRIFIQLVKGLKALHDLKILHRDLKSANVFLFKDSSAKLGDLNVSKVARRGLGYTQTGTPYYASPEVWRDSPYNNKSDIWSLGCVLYEMITLKPPFRAENMEGLYNKVIKGQFNKIPERFSDDLFSIVKLLLKVNSEQRPNCEQILKNPIILKRIEYFKSFSKEDNIDEERALLQTIKIPKNLLSLSDKLPKSNYDNNNDDNNDVNNDINGDNHGLKKYNSFHQKKELNHSVSTPKIIMNNIIPDDLPKIKYNINNENNNNNYYYYYKINNKNNNLNKIQEEDDFINNNKINNDSNNNSDIKTDRILKKIINKNLKQNNLAIIHNNKYKFKNNSVDFDDKNFIVNMEKDNINNNMNNKKINLIENYNNKNRVLINKYSKLNLNNNKYRIYKLYAPYLFENNNNQFNNNNKKFKNNININNNNNILNKKLLNHYLINNISNYKSIAYLKNLEKYYENYNKLKKNNNNSFINNTNNIKININNNNIFNLKGKFINNNINNINKKIYEANRNHSLEQKNTLKLNKRKLSPIRKIIN